MIKRSAILLLFLALGSFSLLLYASYTQPTLSKPVNNSKPVKCSGPCKKKNLMPVPWNIVSSSMFHRG